ncbi:MAG: hypothetical protein NPINA01_32640 [Nitrospinaceae bacterium]|nr:MAG: hypothetical protein NPINA01_32640 [Nitrospinaceae bacterium]
MSQEKMHPQNFDHSQWLKTIADSWDNAQAFFGEVWETCKVLFKKALKQGIKEVKFFLSRSTPFDFICGGLNALFGFLAALIFLSGFGLLGYQTLLWLIDGVWTEYPLAIVFNALFENTALHSWVSNPESWYGLQKVVAWTLENIPLSAALIVPGFILASILSGIMAGAIAIRYYQFKKAGKE